MPKIPDCDRCLYCAHDYNLVCALHPTGPADYNCSDFSLDPNLEEIKFQDFLGLLAQAESDSEEQWQPEGARYVNGELVWDCDRSFYNSEEIIQPRQHWTRREQWELVNTHPLFTNKCPECGADIDKYYTTTVHFDCSICGWLDDSI